jgi:hypothetical protein
MKYPTYTKVFSFGKAEHLMPIDSTETLCGRFGGLHTGDTLRIENGKFFVECWNRDLGNIVPAVWADANESDINDICQHCKRKALNNEQPVQIESGEWYFMGCYIQESEHPALFGRFEVFKDDEKQTHVGRYMKFSEAKKAAKVNAQKNGLKSFL